MREISEKVKTLAFTAWLTNQRGNWMLVIGRFGAVGTMEVAGGVEGEPVSKVDPYPGIP